MTEESFSYPKSESALDASLTQLGFLKPGSSTDLSMLDFAIVQEVPEFLWTDIRFFSICQSLNAESVGQWMIDISAPNRKYYLKLYGLLPVIFSSGISSPEEYYNVISRQIGKSTADSIVFVWESCIVLPSSREWAFTFDRESEQGRFYCRASTCVPDELTHFFE